MAKLLSSSAICKQIYATGKDLGYDHVTVHHIIHGLDDYDSRHLMHLLQKMKEQLEYERIRLRELNT